MNFFEKHDAIALYGLAVFPRITLLIGSFATGGALWWLTWLIAPHVLVAILAIPFFGDHPILVTYAWVCAFYGTSGEHKAVNVIKGAHKKRQLRKAIQKLAKQGHAKN